MKNSLQYLNVKFERFFFNGETTANPVYYATKQKRGRLIVSIMNRLKNMSDFLFLFFMENEK